MKLHLKTKVDKLGIDDRVSRITKRSLKSEAKFQGLKMILSMIDLTTLEGMDTTKSVEQLCYKATHLHKELPDLPNVAAVCVYPNMVKTASNFLKDCEVKVASVATAFPSGNSSIEVKIQETNEAISTGADEIDMVISRGKFHSGEYNYVFDEIATIIASQFMKRLKVILETEGVEYNDPDVGEIILKHAPDWIKTSTGKIKSAATLPITLVMLEAIKDHYYTTGKMVGMKPAGGISNSKLALQYLLLVKETLGNLWLDKHWFRFGASSLANDVLMQILKQKTGFYQSNNYFSKD